MFKKFLIVLASLAAVLVLAVGVFAVIVVMQPAEFRIVRSAAVAAPPAEVFAQVNDFHHWDAWSPWAKIDPALKQTYEGPEAGTGAVYQWSGNDKVGEGSMKMTESRPNDLIRIQLDFVRPFEASNTTEFTFEPQGNQTVVTWAMSGQRNFFAKAFSLFVDMDKLVGGDFEKGLAQMKTVVEPAK